MIKEKLARLSNYIDKIEKQKPMDFLYKQMKILEKNVDAESLDSSLDDHNFSLEFKNFLDSYRKQGVSDEVLILGLYQTLLLLTKNNAIYSYAYALGLKPSLYKDEMRLLFKGKMD